MNEATTVDETEKLRERVRDIAAKLGVSLASIGRRAGIPDSTLSAWMNGTYQGKTARISERVRVWLDAQESMSSGRNFVPPAIPFTRTPTAQAILDVFEYAQVTGDVAVVVGSAGVGKTAAAKRYAETRPSVWMLTMDPSLRRAHGVLGYIGDVLGVQEPRTEKLSRAICGRLADTQGLLIIDEAQHLTTEGLDQLRSLHDRAGIGLVIVGNHSLWSRLDGGGRKAQFAQLFSRVGMRLTKDRPTSADIEAILNETGVEEKAQRRMLKAIAAKPGALRGMIKTLRLARMVALAEGEELSEEAIERAYQRLSGATEGV